MDRNHLLFNIAHVLATSINPFLFGIWAALILFSTPRPALRIQLATIIGTIVAVLLAEAGKQHSLWPGSDTFPSGHETFASSICAGLCHVHRRWLLFSICAVSLLGWALVHVHYHMWRDVIGGVGLGSLITTAMLRLFRATGR